MDSASAPPSFPRWVPPHPPPPRSSRSFSTCLLQDSPRGQRCLCPPGFAGVRCEVRRSACASRPCMNGGQCHAAAAAAGGGGFVCQCPPAFSGQLCEVRPHSPVSSRYPGCSSEGWAGLKHIPVKSRIRTRHQSSRHGQKIAFLLLFFFFVFFCRKFPCSRFGVAHFCCRLFKPRLGVCVCVYLKLM